MNAEQTLAAAEVMRRAAEGEPVEARRIGAHDWYPASDPSWTWSATQYRIAEPPPHGENAHNPDSLTPLQVETHLGWRLLDRDEFDGTDAPTVSLWTRPGWDDVPFGRCKVLTYRTQLTREELAEARGIKKPVPWSKPEHVPPLCWIREKDSEFAELITSRGPDQIEGPDNYWTWSDLRSCEYSTTCRADDWHKPEVTP